MRRPVKRTSASAERSLAKLNGNLNATIHALSTVGKTEILSRPSILTRSSQQATILVGQQVPFITDSRITDTGQTINPRFADEYIPFWALSVGVEFSADASDAASRRAHAM